MGILPIESLQLGMSLDEDIKKNGAILIPRGTIITEQILDALNKVSVKACDIVTCPLPKVTVSDSFITFQDIYELYTVFINIVNNYDTLDMKSATESIKNEVEKVIFKILSSERKEIYDLRYKAIDSLNYTHSLSSMLLSIMFGNSLDVDRSELMSIGLSSLFADFGMFMMPTMVWQKPDRLTTADWDIVHKHPRESVNFIRENLNLPYSVNQAILDHHERYDGRGYPEGRKGEKISKYARIIMIPDVYDAMTRDNHYRKRIFRADALEYIAGGAGVLFDGEFVNHFVRKFIMYPIGTAVRLSNGAIGMVLTNKYNSKRPIVVVYYMNGQLLDECFALDLNDVHNLNITITDCYGM